MAGSTILEKQKAGDLGIVRLPKRTSPADRARAGMWRIRSVNNTVSLVFAPAHTVGYRKFHFWTVGLNFGRQSKTCFICFVLRKKLQKILAA